MLLLNFCYPAVAKEENFALSADRTLSTAEARGPDTQVCDDEIYLNNTDTMSTQYVVPREIPALAFTQNEVISPHSRIVLKNSGAGWLCFEGQGMILSGDTQLRVEGSRIQVRGFVFRDQASMYISDRVVGVNIKDNLFVNRNSRGITIGLEGSDILIEGNSFFHTAGINVLILSPRRDQKTQAASRNIRIRSNTFAEIEALGRNGGEAIIVGIADFTAKNRWVGALIENNYFFRANGDSELISIKSDGNIFRNNFIFNSNGHIGIRMGNYNRIEDNIVLASLHPFCVRVVGRANMVLRNYFTCQKASVVFSDQFRDPVAMGIDGRNVNDEASIVYDASINNIVISNYFVGGEFLIGWVKWDSAIFKIAEGNLVAGNCFKLKSSAKSIQKSARKRAAGVVFVGNIIDWSSVIQDNFRSNIPRHSDVGSWKLGFGRSMCDHASFFP